MFNICNLTKIKNFGDWKLSHIQHQIHHGGIVDCKYSYFGKKISKGIVTVQTKYGLLKIKFNESNGWATELEAV